MIRKELAGMADEKEASAEAEETTTEQQQQKPDVPPEVKAALRRANKEAETLRLKLQEFEDRDKTEAQKLTERAEAAERALADTEARALRLEIAAEKGLTAAQARRLVGSTREELEADAAELLDTFKPAVDGQAAATAASLDLGNIGTPAAKGSPEADFSKFLAGQLGRTT